jgi:hypothetical protein
MMIPLLQLVRGLTLFCQQYLKPDLKSADYTFPDVGERVKALIEAAGMTVEFSIIASLCMEAVERLFTQPEAGSYYYVMIAGSVHGLARSLILQ